MTWELVTSGAVGAAAVYLLKEAGAWWLGRRDAEHGVRFAKVYERQIDALDQIYPLVVRASRGLQCYMDAPSGETRVQAEADLARLSAAAEENALRLPPEAGDTVGQYVARAQEVLNHSNVASGQKLMSWAGMKMLPYLKEVLGAITRATVSGRKPSLPEPPEPPYRLGPLDHSRASPATYVALADDEPGDAP